MWPKTWGLPEEMIGRRLSQEEAKRLCWLSSNVEPSASQALTVLDELADRERLLAEVIGGSHPAQARTEEGPSHLTAGASWQSGSNSALFALRVGRSVGGETLFSLPHRKADIA